MQKYQKDTNGKSNGNLIESSYDLGTATNLILNNKFEVDLTGSWRKLEYKNSGYLQLDTSTKTISEFSGTKSLKINVQATSAEKSYIAVQYRISLFKQIPNTP